MISGSSQKRLFHMPLQFARKGSLLDGLLHSPKLKDLASLLARRDESDESFLDRLLQSQKLADLKSFLSHDAEMCMLIRMAVKQDGLALEHALSDVKEKTGRNYLDILKAVNTQSALKGTNAQVFEALRKKSSQLEVLQLAVEQTGLALCIALDVELPHDALIGDVPYSFFTHSELEQAVRAWRGKSLDETMTNAEARREDLHLGDSWSGHGHP